MSAHDSRQAGAISVDTARLEKAADLLWRFDPEQHRLEDYALTIAETIVGQRLCRRDAGTECISSS